ncbi:MAG: hypothetical protein DI537_43780 [Stutzerimonas stutzeri]|nr:MAG: hypothetical protein DI537_43780 [Stutzerimonas stutzeri]
MARFARTRQPSCARFDRCSSLSGWLVAAREMTGRGSYRAWGIL